MAGGRIVGQLNKLTSREVETKSEKGRYGDGGGLYLIVTHAIGADGEVTVRRKWTFMFRLNGKRHEMGLGPAGKGGVSLAQARKLANEARELVQQGYNPIEHREMTKREQSDAERRKNAIPTFREAAISFVETHSPSWKSLKHRQQWRSTLMNDARLLGPIPVDAITREDVLKVLQPIWLKKPETASRLRGRIERVLDAAIVAGYREAPNPAIWKGGLKSLLPDVKRSSRIVHHRSMDWREVPGFVSKLREQQEASCAALALEFLVLTAARTGEVIGAVWAEIETGFEGGPIWRIPAERMKAQRDHEVPLSKRAQEILGQVKPLAQGNPEFPLFPSPTFRPSRVKHLSSMAMMTVLDRLNYRERTTVHGFRSSFRIWAAEQTSFPRAVAEAALAHSNPDRVEAAYQRSTLLPQRRLMMEQWADWCGRGMRDENIVSFGQREAAAQ